MGKKRRGEDQRQSDSEIRHKCLQNGSTSSRVSPEDISQGTSLESILQQMAHGLSMTTGILREMQDKDEKFREEKNEQKFKEMEEKNEKKIKEMEERNEMKFKEMEEMNEKKFKEMEEELEKQNNECKVMKKELEELKDGAVARSSGYASPAQRTEPDYSLQPRLNLKILSEMKDKSYKGKIIRTKTMDCVEVGLFDGDNPISHDHHLSSAKVKLVILKEEFYKDGEDYWSKEDFMQALKRHGDRNTAMRIEKCTFNLTSGYARHPGAIILDNSNRKAVRLGVMIMGPCKERVLEGISNPFKVQEAKTDKKKPEDGITADNGLQQQAPMNNRSQPTTTQPASENGEEGITADNGEQQQDPMNNRSHHTIAQSASENGNILAANRQKQMYLPDPTNKWLLSAIARSAEDGQGIGGCYQQNSMYMSHDTAITCNGHGESFQTLQDFGQPHNSFMPAICGGDDTLFVLPGFQTQSTSDPERTEYAGDLHPQTQNQVIPYVQSGNGGSIILNRVQLQFDEPNVEPRQWWNILDKLMPLFPDKRLVHEYDRLFASDYFRKTMMRVHGTMGIANRGMQHHNRGVLIQCLEDSDSEHEPPIKTKRQASYQLRFVNKACREYYVGGQIKAEDGGLLKVALYNDDSLRITSGPLSSASVEIVLLHGDFNADGQDYWSADKFGNYILCPLSEEPPALGGDCVLTLVDGEASLSCACFQKTSSFARTGKFTMGVKMKTTLEERVQEGITQPFLVQVRQDEDSNYTYRPSGLAGGLTKLSEEVSTSPDRGSLMRRTGSSFLTEQAKVMVLHPGYEEVICIKSELGISKNTGSIDAWNVNTGADEAAVVSSLRARQMERVCENTVTIDFKQAKMVATIGESWHSFLPAIRSGDWSDIGGRDYMEDAHVCIPNLAKNFGYQTGDDEIISFYGVFDGHGGKDAALYVRDNLPRVIVEDAAFPLELEKVVRRSFAQTDSQFAEKCSVHNGLSSGTTALTAMIFGRSLLVANAGDCRAVLSRGGAAIEMSKDHRTCCLSERKRVESLGGYVDDGYLNGQLVVTRALGDWHLDGLKEMGEPGGPLSAEPELKMITLTKDDEFLIIGSDGIWDYFSNQNSVDFARRRLQEHNDPRRCCKEIVEEAIRRGATDNLTAVMVSFHQEAPPLMRVGSRGRVERNISAEGLHNLRVLLDGQ